MTLFQNIDCCIYCCLMMEESNKFTADDSADSSSESVLTDEWQELCKSDYAKVIFSDLFYDASSGNVECKFQITDNVHEDPCDFVGLYRIGYDNLSQCFISKFLSETKCEDDGKLQHCVFNLSTLPLLEDGFYQFLYVTRDNEVCGASMPFEIKQIQNQPKEESSDDDVIAEKADDDFLLVRRGVERKNQLLEDLLEKYRRKNQSLTFELEELMDSKDKICKEKEETIVYLSEQVISWKSQNSYMESQMSEKVNTIKNLKEEIENHKLAYEKLQQKNERLEDTIEKSSEDNSKLKMEVRRIKLFNKACVIEREPQNFSEQLEDQLCMIKALEDSKQLAMKEMSDLSESLSMRTHVLNCTRTELAQCKTKLKDATLAQEKQSEEIKKLCKEVNDLMQVLGEKEDALTTHYIKIDSLENEVTKLKDELMQSKKNTESEATLELEKNAATKKAYLFAEASNILKELHPLIIEMADVTDMNDSLESKSFYEIKIQLLILLSNMRRTNDGKRETQFSPQAEKTLDSMLAAFPQIPPETLASTLETVLKTGNECTGTQTSYSTGNINSATVNSNIENTEKTKEELIFNIFPIAKPPFRTNDVSSAPESMSNEINEKWKCRQIAQECSDEDLKKVSEIYLSKTEIVPENIPDIQLQIMSELNTAGIRNLDLNDVAAVNQMTERVVNKYSCFSATNEELLAEDSSSDTDYEYDSNDESETSESSQRKKSKAYSLRRKLLCIERIINVLKAHLHTTLEWSHLIAGYNMEYAALPPKQQINLLLDKCKSLYQISVLMDHITKQKEDLKKMSRRTCELLSQFMMWTNEEMELKCNLAAKETELVAKEAELAKLREENVKNNATISFMSAEKLNWVSKETTLQETINEHAARITEAAEIYKRQFVLIQKLKKKLRKYKLTTMVSSSSSSSSSRELSPSENRNTGSSFEAQRSQPQRNISDSDTGEHVSSSGQNGNKKCEVLKPLGARPKTNVFRTNASGPSSTSSSQIQENTISESANSETIASESSSEDATVEAAKEPAVGSISLKGVQKIVSSKIGKPLKSANGEPNLERLLMIPCVLCDKEIWITSKTAINLVNHLEKKHQINVCPVCGQLFESVVPKKYLNYHIEDHFRS
ncbi:SKICH domain-containing protein [Nephila pilipes]|uniref:SKICH domain-containing protein n=1 Tax=Nephila pilipes TaxID=299642 RepID=A0A8X6P5H5_NEPPI|nr:SKICH domain-containing protein [Nephila pilipes]